MIAKFRENMLDLSLFIKANLLLSILIFLVFMPLNDHYIFSTYLFIFGASISTAATLYLIYYIILMPFSWFKITFAWFSASIFILTNIALIVDFFIFRIWKFHINAMVINILFSPDAFDSIQIGIMPIIAAILILVFFVIFEFYLYTKIHKALVNNKKKLNRNINVYALSLLFMVILAEKIIYGFANMYAKTEYLEPTKVIPLYQPMDFTGFMEETFDMKGETSQKQSLSINSNKNLNYPTKPITISKPNPTNIFIFALDSARASIMSSEVAPNIYDLAKSSSVYTNHMNGGNATRFGIFSMMYGLNSSYWFVFLNAQKGSILFNTLLKLDYQTHIFSATSTAWPEFRKTAYFDIQNSISDEHTGLTYEKDKQTTDEFLQWVDNADLKKPLFSFVFLDSPHSNSYPKTHRNFLPDHYGEVNYLTVNEKDTQTLLNQYKNAIFYNDELVGDMIKKLKEKGLYENSIIIITADHGQEFYEHGNFGHNSSYNYEQVHVPFIVHLPKSEHKVINKLTSHLDIVPTLMSYVGVDNETKDYSSGYSLLSPEYNREFAYIGNWNDNAILTDEYVNVFSNLPDRIFDNKTYKTKSYELVTDQKDTKRQAILLKVLDENSRFIH